jgi:hypothetical protein
MLADGPLAAVRNTEWNGIVPAPTVWPDWAGLTARTVNPDVSAGESCCGVIEFGCEAEDSTVFESVPGAASAALNLSPR